MSVIFFRFLPKSEFIDIPYILESNPPHFFSFRGLKNQMRIRFAVESWILKKMIEPLYVP